MACPDVTAVSYRHHPRTIEIDSAIDDCLGSDADTAALCADPEPTDQGSRPDLDVSLPGEN
jgi:hypothetical protein